MEYGKIESKGEVFLQEVNILPGWSPSDEGRILYNKLNDSLYFGTSSGWTQYQGIGYSGYSGSRGFSGYSGIHGPAAMSGYSGISGYEGSGVPIGIILPYLSGTSPAGWLLCDGQTVGNPSSGATARANNDAQDLFELLWNSTNNTELIIQDSSGSPTIRGASATIDWSANKRMPLPDLRGRTIIGKDDMGGSSANVVTDPEADLVCGKAGEEDHTLSIAEMPSHQHIETGWSGAVGYMGVGSGCPTPTLTGSTGGDGAHNNMQPYMTLNYIIKYSLTTGGGGGGGGSILPGADERLARYSGTTTIQDSGGPSMDDSGNLNMYDMVIQRAKFRDSAEVVNVLGSISGATTINLESGNIVTATNNGAIIWTFNNPPSSGNFGAFTLVYTNGGAASNTWPVSVKWSGGSPPSLSALGTDILTFVTVNGGSTWFGTLSMGGMS